MPQTIAIRLAVGSLLLVGAAACNGKNEAGGSASAPPSGGTHSAGTTTPSTGPAPTPKATASKPKVTQSKQIVMIDPEGKRYTFTTMAQMAAGMRATMGEHAPSGFCETSYMEGVKKGGTFPAGRDVFLAACHEGWRKTERYMQGH